VTTTSSLKVNCKLKISNEPLISIAIRRHAVVAAAALSVLSLSCTYTIAVLRSINNKHMQRSHYRYLISNKNNGPSKNLFSHLEGTPIFVPYGFSLDLLQTYASRLVNVLNVDSVIQDPCRSYILYLICGTWLRPCYSPSPNGKKSLKLPTNGQPFATWSGITGTIKILGG